VFVLLQFLLPETFQRLYRGIRLLDGLSTERELFLVPGMIGSQSGFVFVDLSDVVSDRCELSHVNRPRLTGGSH